MGGSRPDPEETNTGDLSKLLVLLTLLAFLLRFGRLFVGIWTNLTYKATPIPKSPTYTPEKDVTVVIPTVYKKPSELAECVSRVLACRPKAIFVILLDSNVAPCNALCKDNGFTNVTVLGVPKLGKRLQMVRALKEIETSIVVWADDDVFWPTRFLDHVIAIFEDPKVGAGGSLQRVRRSNGTSWCPTNFWNILGISYLERRVFNNLNSPDGSLSTLSGRSSAYRTAILKNEDFISSFCSDSWNGQILNSDDDKHLTRYLFKNQWEIKIQSSVYLETTLEESSAYIHQCLRWARARFRGNLTVMREETYWRSWKYAYGAYAIYLGMFQNPSILIDFCFYKLVSLILAPCSPETRSWSIVAFFVWVLFTKVVRLIPHFLRNPADLVWLPVLISFGYFHSLLNIYAFCTLSQTAWGGKDLTALSKSKDKTEKEETTPLFSATSPPAADMV